MRFAQIQNHWVLNAVGNSRSKGRKMEKTKKNIQAFLGAILIVAFASPSKSEALLFGLGDHAVVTVQSLAIASDGYIKLGAQQ